MRKGARKAAEMLARKRSGSTAAATPERSPKKRSKSALSKVAKAATAVLLSSTSSSSSSSSSALSLSKKPSSQLLFPLAERAEYPLVRGTVVQRPSARNKSPYVGDVKLADTGRVVIVHMPCLDMGGKCGPGAEVMLRPAVDKKTGKLVGADAVSKAYGTPRCEFIMMLLKCSEPENQHLGGAWVGAHPSLGERTALALLQSGALDSSLALPVAKDEEDETNKEDVMQDEKAGEKTEKKQKAAAAAATTTASSSKKKKADAKKDAPPKQDPPIRREVTGVAGTDMRCDFLIRHDDGSRTVLEVKTVVDTDYDSALISMAGEDDEDAGGDDGEKSSKKKAKKKSKKQDQKIRFYGPPSSSGPTYERAGIFPWGRSNQVGPEGEKVVSARAIKHVRELTAIATGERTMAGDAKSSSSISSSSSSSSSEVCKGGEEGEGWGKLHAAVLFVVARRDATKFRCNAEACPSFARYVAEAKQKGVTVLARRVRWEELEGGGGEGEGEGGFAGGAIDDGPIPVEL